MRIGTSISIPNPGAGAALSGPPALYVPPSCTLLLRGDAATGPLGGALTGWPDQSGQNVSLTPNGLTGAKPTRDSTGRYVNFVQANTTRLNNTVAPLYSSTGMLGNNQPVSGLGLVWMNSVTDAFRYDFLQCGAPGTASGKIFFSRVTTTLTFIVSDAAGTTHGPSCPLTGLAGQWVIVWFTSDGNTGNIGINNSTVQASAATTADSSSGVGGASSVGAGTATGNPLDGRIALLMTSKVLWSAADLNNAIAAAQAYKNFILS